MSYEHCEKHNEDATNGCHGCAKETEDQTLEEAWLRFLGEHDPDHPTKEAFHAGWQAHKLFGTDKP